MRRRLFSTLDNRQPTIAAHRPGFSLVELLVVIGIIALLAGILFPTISKVRLSSQEANSKNLLNQIDTACQAYFTDFKAYPGPLPYAVLNAADQTLGGTFYVYNDVTAATQINSNQATFISPTTATTFEAASTNKTRVTGAENLVLGLCGGLALDRTTNRYYYDAGALGQGPAGFNALRPNRATAFMQPTNLSKGKVADEAGNATGVDSIIPEFVDSFATPMPFLYMRSRNLGVYSASAAQPESLVVNNATANNDYDIVEVQPYTSYRTGGGGTLKPSDYVNVTYSPSASPHGLQTANFNRTTDKANKIPGIQYQYPYDAYDYLVDPASYDRTQASTPTAAQYAAKRSRKKDSYVLIGAGRDRIYGTADDLTNFGSVLP